MIKGASISPCGQFRWWLKRVWDAQKPQVLYVMLNPSTADSELDDATIRKCIGFASRLGFGGFQVANLCPYRARNPKDMFRWITQHPIILEKEYQAMNILLRMARDLDMPAILAWGSKARNPLLSSRKEAMLQRLKHLQMRTYTLRRLPDGTPAHPLMLPYTCKLELFER